MPLCGTGARYGASVSKQTVFGDEFGNVLDFGGILEGEDRKSVV